MTEKKNGAEKGKPKVCFVVGPIGDEDSDTRVHADWLFDLIIKPVFDSDYAEWSLLRADKINIPGQIDKQIIGHLLKDALVICDLSELNANAFYELGIRHTMRLPTVHMFLEGTRIPFDISLHRAIKFSRRHPNDLIKARAALSSVLKEATHHEYEVDNPVVQTQNDFKIREHASSDTKILLDRIAALESKYDRDRTERNRDLHLQTKSIFSSDSSRWHNIKSEWQPISLATESQYDQQRILRDVLDYLQKHKYPTQVFGFSGNELQLAVSKASTVDPFYKSFVTGLLSIPGVMTVDS